jgi:hypothetical protein
MRTEGEEVKTRGLTSITRDQTGREEWTALLARIGHSRRSEDSAQGNKLAITPSTPQLNHRTASNAMEFDSHDGQNNFTGMY